LALIGAHFYCFNVGFQDVEEIVGKRGQFLGNRFEFRQGGSSWNSGNDGSIESMDPFPGRRPLPRRRAWDVLLEAGGDDLDDVAPGDADPLTGILNLEPIGLHFFR
jgi:hypothetical protein